MKTIRIIALAFTAMLMVSCSGGGGKFEGEWKPIKSHFGDKFVIKKTANAYKLTKDDKEDDSFLFLYDKDRDILSVEVGRGEIIDIEYNEKTKTIKMKPRGGGGWGEQAIEMERIK
jgi:hypothetical protein